MNTIFHFTKIWITALRLKNKNPNKSLAKWKIFCCIQKYSFTKHSMRSIYKIFSVFAVFAKKFFKIILSVRKHVWLDWKIESKRKSKRFDVSNVGNNRESLKVIAIAIIIVQNFSMRNQRISFLQIVIFAMLRIFTFIEKYLNN